MTKTKTINNQTSPEKVSQSQLGMFLKLINEETPLGEIPSMGELAKTVSENFDVECTSVDLEAFFELDSGLPDENYEVESRKQQFYKGEHYE